MEFHGISKIDHFIVSDQYHSITQEIYYGLGHNNSSNKFVQIKNLIKNFVVHIFKISQRNLIDIDQSYKMTLRSFHLDN